MMRPPVVGKAPSPSDAKRPALLSAGNSKISPSRKVRGLPAMITSPRPSMPWTKASKGEVCSLKPCPSSNAKTVTLPLSRFRITRLTTDPS